MNIGRLSKREAQVLECLMMGQTNKAIAKSMGVSVDTIKAQVKSILLKLHAKTRNDAAMMCMRAALTLPCPRCGYVDVGQENGHDGL